MTISRDVKGETFNRLTAIEKVYNKGYKEYWEFQCKCGIRKIIAKHHVVSSETKSCGCLLLENKGYNNKPKYTHNMSKSKIYGVWRGIKDRIYLKTSNAYKHYGGRGIKCEWKTFEEFYEDMGASYQEGLQIDRVNNNGNYCQENCKWTTSKEQQRNRRNNKKVSFLGKEYLLIELSELFNIKYSTLVKRLNLGWDIEKALHTPVRVRVYIE